MVRALNFSLLHDFGLIAVKLKIPGALPAASTMGSRDWLKNIINLSKSRKPKSKKIKAENKLETQIQEKSKFSVNDSACENPMVEDIAATRIQTAFRAFKARKTLRHLKGVQRLQTLTQCDIGKKKH
ncbi:hypothetical protein L2E82_24715 [Cichorium intybus]|uniref:Uncharacterized protein n=1 Tax=Cichorium intybus TaxID=13427 RepID=A0ACB9E1X0_CICIN|nr:hypothetical protein L2E82_24715 [Cichorium intybus]